MSSYMETRGLRGNNSFRRMLHYGLKYEHGQFHIILLQWN